MRVSEFHGWGGTSRGAPARTVAPSSVNELTRVLACKECGSFLGRGLGRSYGDSALNTGGMMIDCRFLDRLTSFDAESGVLECEAGVCIGEINRLLASKGWILPVVPGTRFVTIGGAIANDVHGKNHQRAGTFGAHLISLRLLRSNGETLECSHRSNADLFAATIGGLGLTGLVVSAKIQLRSVNSLSMYVNHIRFNDLEELFSLAERHLESWEYHAAWMDPAAAGHKGLYIVARHTDQQGDLDWPGVRGLRLAPMAGFATDLPGRLFMKAANTWYRRVVRSGMRQASLESVLYPLDRLPDWNALFGKAGFFQHQCVLPVAGAADALGRLLRVVENGAQPFSLAVGKWFGQRKSPGLLSFPAPGFSLALDFSNRGMVTRNLLDELDKVVADCGGKPYPAKDARMASSLFVASYPALAQFKQHIDPRFASDFWRRMEMVT